MMNCAWFERRFEAFLAGRLSDGERGQCEAHVAGCEDCRELVELASLPAGAGSPAPPKTLPDAILAATSGAACDQAEALLCSFVDGELTGADHDLVAGHLESCAGCNGLAYALLALNRELPRMAELRPEPSLVAAILAATLPLDVRLRRWWQQAWPRWIRRPRFAIELAYVSSLILVVLVAFPGSPLAAMPERAAELTRSGSRLLEVPIEERLEGLGATRPAQKVGQIWATATETAQRTPALLEEGKKKVRTILESAASLFSTAEEEPAEPSDNEGGSLPDERQETP